MSLILPAFMFNFSSFTSFLLFDNNRVTMYVDFVFFRFDRCILTAIVLYYTDAKYVYHKHTILRSIVCLWYNLGYIDIRNLNDQRVDT